MRPLFLISNDDGLHASGLYCLIRMLRPIGDIVVVVPERERSGMSMAFTSPEPLHYTKVSEEPGLQIYISNGTPTDCVKQALNLLMKDRWPDLVITGINHGFNASVAIHYSGTMGAAMEAVVAGVPAIGLSIDNHDENPDFNPALPYMEELIRKALKHGIPKGVCLNVNAPNTPDIKGMKICRQGSGRWVQECEACVHPRKNDLYWLSGRFENLEPDATDNDLYALQQGYISVVPSQIDMTSYAAIKEMASWDIASI